MFYNSFRGRLILGAIVWICIALAASGYLLSVLLREVVTAQIDHDLSDHAEELSGVAVIDADGRVSVRRKLSDPRFAIPHSGLYWQLERLDGVGIHSDSLNGGSLLLNRNAGTSPRISVVDTPMGPVRLNQRVISSPQLSQPLRLGIGVEVGVIENELAHLNRALAISIGVIAIGLVGAAIIQVAYGLRPLTRLRRALVSVRNGKADRLPDDLPVEVVPLVRDLNAMIAANNEMIRRARAQAGSLAHALKTPLAILMEEGHQLEKLGQLSAGRTIRDQCSQMQRQVDYQMARARAAGRGTPGAATELGPSIHQILAALTRLHQRRGISIELNGEEDVVVACDPQDLNEIIGNLADNAAKWARSRVVVSISRNDGNVIIKVEDDGRGIPDEATERVFGLGERLDETMPGSGLGLPITRELVSLYGGQVWLERSPLGGTAACLKLPVLEAHWTAR